MLPFAVLAPVPALVAALPPRPPVPADVARSARRVTGRVSDAVTGKPIANALVQQAGAVATGFTDALGAYTLALDAKAVGAVLVSAAGYESRRVSVGGDRLDVALAPLKSYVPTRPAQPIVELPNSKAEVAPFNSGVRFTYGLRRQDIAAGGTSVAGTVTNEFALGLRYRARPWLVEAEGGHYQSHVDVPNMAQSANPAFKPSTWQAALRGGPMWALRPELETAVMVGYRFRNVAPNNNDIPYTGTGLDASQTQHALGGIAAVAWKPGAGRVVLEGALGLYPLVYAHSDDTRVAPFAGSLGADARAAALYEVIPGLRAGLGYQFETWRGTGSDTSSVFSLVLHYTPGGLPRGNEP